MSGVFGVVDPTDRVNIHALSKKMMEEMSHRDWYVTESFVDNNENLVIGRIGIGIFNKASQPVWNLSGSVALVMAGEFYNRDELGENEASYSDEQLAMVLYEKFGDKFVSQINGAFIIAVYDKKKNHILIANDRFGFYPHYYACYNQSLVFAPEVKGILCNESFPRELDLTALAQYVRFQHLLGERTFFNDVYQLPSASVLRYDIATGSCSVKSYWSFDDIPYCPDVSFDEAVEEVGMLFRRAVRRLSGDNYRPGVYLSGGLDSRSILGMIERRPVVSLTYGERNCRDVYYAGRIAKAAGSDHHWIDLPNGEWVKNYVDFHLDLTEGFHSWIHAHGMSTLSRARQLMDVNLTGWDGGTVMGHHLCIEPLQISPVDETAFITRMFYLFTDVFTWPSLSEAEENLLYSTSLRGQLRGLAFDSFRDEISRFLGHRKDVRGEYFCIANHCRRLTQNFIVFTRSHVEVRIPFFDYDLFNFLYSLPATVRGEEKLYRAMIQREMPPLSYIPYDHDEILPTTKPYLHKTHAEMVKFKRRFNRHVAKVFSERHPLYADYETYLRTDLRGWAEDILYDQRTVEHGIFEPSFLRSLMNRHLSSLENWTIGKIAPLITYEMMLRRFYD